MAICLILGTIGNIWVYYIQDIQKLSLKMHFHVNIECYLHDWSFMLDLCNNVNMYMTHLFMIFSFQFCLVDGFFISLKYDYCFYHSSYLVYLLHIFPLLPKVTHSQFLFIFISWTMNYFNFRICGGISHSSFCSNWAAHN